MFQVSIRRASQSSDERGSDRVWLDGSVHQACLLEHTCQTCLADGRRNWKFQTIYFWVSRLTVELLTGASGELCVTGSE